MSEQEILSDVKNSKKIVTKRLYAKGSNPSGAKCKIHSVSEEIIERTGMGCTIKDRIAGLINRSTYLDWIAAGDLDLLNNIDNEFSQFSCGIRVAEKRFRDHLRESIKCHGLNDWKASAWLLERSDPESYKLKDKVDVKQEVEVTQKAFLQVPDNGRRAS